MRISDWSSDVCSSDLFGPDGALVETAAAARRSKLWLLPRRLYQRSAPAGDHTAGHFQLLVSVQMIDRLIAFLVLSIVLGAPFGLTLVLTSSALLNFVFFYPLFMSGIWMSGGMYFWLHWERKWNWRPYRPPQLPGLPLISILIPCYNEADNAEETILAALGQEYPNIEVIAVNDGSTDGTAALFDRLAAEHDRLRVIHLAQNQGKAMALRMGAMAARSAYLICIDGDALLAPDDRKSTSLNSSH